MYLQSNFFTQSFKAYYITFHLISSFFLQTINRRLRSSITPLVNTKLQASLNRVYQDVEKLKRKFYRPSPRLYVYSNIFFIFLEISWDGISFAGVEPRPAEILLPPLSGSTAGELDCILCCRLLWKPVTTPCGHTYCWMCLDRCLDYSSACPLCVTSLADVRENS